MLERKSQPLALALHCDRSGTIVTVLYDGIHRGAAVGPGSSFVSLISEDCRDQARHFLDTLRVQPQVFNHPLKVCVDERHCTLYFRGSSAGDSLFIVGTTSPGKLEGASEGSGATAPEPNTLATADVALYDELSRINNELVTTQRQLAQQSSEQQRLAEENARLFHEAQEALQMQNAFLSILTHDLKTPLSGIVGFAQLIARRLERDASPDITKTLKGLHRILEIAESMTDQVNGLLELARLEQGKELPLRKEAVDLVAIVRRVSAQLQPDLMQPRIKVEAEPIPLIGEWDVRQLERVVENLLSNAIKYSPKGGDITVVVGKDASANGQSQDAVLRVRDQGIGIPASDLKHIFEPFHRARNTTSRIDGTGIGLFSVRQIVEQHGGTVAVESTEGMGTTFTIRLPLTSPKA